MAINKVNKDLPTATKIEKVNDMVIELNGKIKQGQFNKNEIDVIYDTIASARKFLRDVKIGNTTSNYTDWTHVKAEDGFSIWKLTPSNYTYNALNQLYLDDKVLENRGSASAETVSTFDTVFLYNGDSGSGYVNNTTEAGTEVGTEFAVMDTTTDFLYLGSDSTFGGIKFEWETRGSNYNLELEYWDGSVWTQLTANNDNLDESTSNFRSDGHITFDIPSNWNTTAVNSVTRYWIRISTTTDPVTTAKLYYVIPATTVIGLLALSSTEQQNEEWAWCSFNNTVYVTIRNSGLGTVEGDFFITSSSSTANLQNFFVHNHVYTLDHQDSRYNTQQEITASTAITGIEGVILADASSATADITITLPEAFGNEGMEFVIKRVDASPNDTVIATESGETIDGAGSKTLSTQYAFMRLRSDGANWHIIGGGSL